MARDIQKEIEEMMHCGMNSISNESKRRDLLVRYFVSGGVIGKSFGYGYIVDDWNHCSAFRISSNSFSFISQFTMTKSDLFGLGVCVEITEDEWNGVFQKIASTRGVNGCTRVEGVKGRSDPSIDPATEAFYRDRSSACVCHAKGYPLTKDGQRCVIETAARCSSEVDKAVLSKMGKLESSGHFNSELADMVGAKSRVKRTCRQDLTRSLHETISMGYVPRIIAVFKRLLVDCDGYSIGHYAEGKFIDNTEFFKGFADGTSTTLNQIHCWDGWKNDKVYSVVTILGAK